jgi:hypothetical protein
MNRAILPRRAATCRSDEYKVCTSRAGRPNSPLNNATVPPEGTSHMMGWLAGAAHAALPRLHKRAGLTIMTSINGLGRTHAQLAR